jgi:hypothetical protein
MNPNLPVNLNLGAAGFCVISVVQSMVSFANSYVDRLFEQRDGMGLYQVISVVARDRELPEEFWLFCRLLEWVGSTRSGVWQYYEGLAEDTFTRMSQALPRFGLIEAAQQYRFGRATWDGPDRAASLDGWLDVHAQEIERAALEMILRRKVCLYEQQ